MTFALRRAPALRLALCLCAAALPAAAQRPLAVGLAGSQAGWRPVVSAHGVLDDPALRDALSQGLPLRFHLRVELWHKGTFDALEGSQEISLAVLRSTLEPGYTLDTGRSEQRFATLREVDEALQGAFASTLHASGGGRYYYLATLDVETLSLSDIDELRRWLRGEARPAVEGRAPVGRAVGRGLRRAFIRLLGLPTRHYTVRSPFFSPRARTIPVPPAPAPHE
ncbi:MAG TPA: hypothetical protein VFE05_09115 [Longimicrobiaceae bacterium]|nr:hypothetical protein [Longimicrobiaceae bacterium]